jgi:hypothetical protein
MDLEETEARITVLAKTSINLTDRPRQLVTGLLVFSHCELLLLDTGSCGREYFGNRE